MTDKLEDSASKVIKIFPEAMKAEFFRVLVKYGFREDKAILCAEIFTENSTDGVYTHGVNRFSKFIEYVREQYIIVNEDISPVSTFGGIEQWNGNLGPGPLNALQATERVMELSKAHGIGCIGLSNTNHWMRGGLYGWKAAKAGFIFIGWSNTIANMPAWGALDCKLGNNPLVIAVPLESEAIVLDMAMSQYSYGAMELHKIKSHQLAVPGGYDRNGEMSKDPGEILISRQVLPIGYWKGAGLSLLLDIVATVLSAGNSTYQITQKGSESAVSQVFIAIDISKLSNYQGIHFAVSEIISDYHNSVQKTSKEKIKYPGERILITRKENLETGIPVDETIWNEIKNL